MPRNSNASALLRRQLSRRVQIFLVYPELDRFATHLHPERAIDHLRVDPHDNIRFAAKLAGQRDIPRQFPERFDADAADPMLDGFSELSLGLRRACKADLRHGKARQAGLPQLASGRNIKPIGNVTQPPQELQIWVGLDGIVDFGKSLYGLPNRRDATGNLINVVKEIRRVVALGERVQFGS